MGTSDPIAAAARARQIPDEKARNSAFKKIAEAIARRDPAAAIAFAKAHAPELLKGDELGEAIGDGASNQQPEEAARQLAGLGEVRKLDDATERWAAKDRAGALAWARNIPDGKVRATALEGIYRQWFIGAPKEAAEAMLRENREGPEFQKLANLALTHWPKDDEASARAWAARLPESIDLAQGFGFMAERAGREDPTSGAKWLETLPVGGARDEAIARYGTQVVQKDGAAALEWARTIGDSAKRLETMQQLTKDWFNRRPAEAFEWLQNNTVLTPEEKAEVLKR